MPQLHEAKQLAPGALAGLLRREPHRHEGGALRQGALLLREAQRGQRLLPRASLLGP
jgi:hypothetical protein